MTGLNANEPMTDMGMPMVASDLYYHINHASTALNNPPIYITETGLADKSDTLRAQLIQSYYAEVSKRWVFVAGCASSVCLSLLACGLANSASRVLCCHEHTCQLQLDLVTVVVSLQLSASATVKTDARMDIYLMTFVSCVLSSL